MLRRMLRRRCALLAGALLLPAFSACGGVSSSSEDGSAGASSAETSLSASTKLIKTTCTLRDNADCETSLRDDSKHACIRRQTDYRDGFTTEDCILKFNTHLQCIIDTGGYVCREPFLQPAWDSSCDPFEYYACQTLHHED